MLLDWASHLHLLHILGMHLLTSLILYRQGLNMSGKD